MVTVFVSILNEIKIHMVQNRKENCHHDDIPFNLKGNIVFSVFINAFNSIYLGAAPVNIFYIYIYIYISKYTEVVRKKLRTM